MFPMVPYHALPALHEELKGDLPRPYNGIIETYREIIPTLLRQLKDPNYFVPSRVAAYRAPVQAGFASINGCSGIAGRKSARRAVGHRGGATRNETANVPPSPTGLTSSASISPSTDLISAHQRPRCDSCLHGLQIREEKLASSSPTIHPASAWRALAEAGYRPATNASWRDVQASPVRVHVKNSSRDIPSRRTAGFSGSLRKIE